jgi:hypothetical protein
VGRQVREFLASLGGGPFYYYESAEGYQSRYGFSDDPVASARLVARLRVIQREYRDLICWPEKLLGRQP